MFPVHRWSTLCSQMWTRPGSTISSIRGNTGSWCSLFLPNVSKARGGIGWLVPWKWNVTPRTHLLKLIVMNLLNCKSNQELLLSILDETIFLLVDWQYILFWHCFLPEESKVCPLEETKPCIQNVARNCIYLLACGFPELVYSALFEALIES